MIKQIPNLFTLINLFLGCVAILFIMQPGLVPVYNISNGYALADVNNSGTQYVSIPEKMCMASVFIMLAAVIDFFDGFIARMFNATSAIGVQLDSLADLVSFGIAPAMILYQFLHLAYAQQPNGLDVSIIWLLPAFIYACAAAYRLARYNIESQSYSGFSGLPSPAAGLLISSFPMIFWYGNTDWFISFLINKWGIYFLIALISWLMLSRLPMMAFKFKRNGGRISLPFILLVIIAGACAFLIGWLAVPVIFVAYVFLSLFFKQRVNDI